MLKVSVCLIVFYSFYALALQKSTFFAVNRFYLVIGLLLSFGIPVLKFSFFESQSNFVLVKILDTSLIDPEYGNFNTQNFANDIIRINYKLIMSVIYFTGIAFLFFKLLFSIVRTIRTKSSETYLFGNVKIMKTNFKVPFSFFNRIYLPKYESNRMIISHELVHVQQFHWLDLVIAEVASVLLWFNPFVVLYKRALKLQHEYLADSSVLKDDFRTEDYLRLMLQQIKLVNGSELVSNFYCKTIKKRILMITKNRTSAKYLGVYLLSIPLICLLLFAFTGNYKTRLGPGVNIVNNDDEYTPSIYPLDASKIKVTNGYGERIDPFSKKTVFHYGIDFAASKGEKVFSTAKGIVIEAKFDTENKKGNFIVIQHSNQYSTFYSHLNIISVKAGDKLNKGQVIGEVGNTGVSTGPHLHYEVIKNNERVNPNGYLPK
jgi:hypothetical protein